MRGLKSLLVIGAAGFLGRALVRQCREQGIRTVGIDQAGLMKDGPDSPDMRCEVDVAAAFRQLPEPVDAAVFAAQGASQRAEAPDVSELFRINAGGVARSLAVLASAGGVPLLHCSTGSVYRPAWCPIAESDEVRQDDAYALSKLHAESMARLHVGRVATVNLRIFGLYGPGQHQRMVPGIAGRVRRNEPVRLARGRNEAMDGGLRISLLHVEDAAAIMIELGQRLVDGESLPGTMNLASDDAPNVREMAEVIAAHLGKQPLFEDGPAREGDLVADTSLLARTTSTRRRKFLVGLAQTMAQDPALGGP